MILSKLTAAPGQSDEVSSASPFRCRILRRLTAGAAVALLAGTTIVPSGCVSAPQCVETIHYDKLAAKAWTCRSDVYSCESKDFKYGFMDGFIGAIREGGDVCQPVVPPKRYWSPTGCRSRDCNVMGSYFSGWAHGVMACEQDGMAGYAQVPLRPRPKVPTPPMDLYPSPVPAYDPVESTVAPITPVLPPPSEDLSEEDADEPDEEALKKSRYFPKKRDTSDLDDSDNDDLNEADDDALDKRDEDVPSSPEPLLFDNDADLEVQMPGPDSTIQVEFNTPAPPEEPMATDFVSPDLSVAPNAEEAGLITPFDLNGSSEPSNFTMPRTALPPS